MEELLDGEGEGRREEGGREEGGKSVRFRCTVELTLRECGGVSQGVGEGRMEVAGNSESLSPHPCDRGDHPSLPPRPPQPAAGQSGGEEDGVQQSL